MEVSASNVFHYDVFKYIVASCFYSYRQLLEYPSIIRESFLNTLTM